nr:MAG TPA: hypothetical protein [Caudoviricetes sp.]
MLICYPSKQIPLPKGIFHFCSLNNGIQTYKEN